MPLPIERARDAVVVDDDVAYLNSAYMGLRLHEVNEAGRAAIETQSRPWDVPSSMFFEPLERLRATFAANVGFDAEGFATVPSVSYGIETAARNLPLRAGERVVTLADQFPSNVYPWRAAADAADAEVVIVDPPQDRTEPWTQQVIEAIDERTAVVAVPNVHWADGRWLDLVGVREACDAVDAALVVDASQSLTVVAIPPAARPDVVTSVGYKWQLGPWSLSWLWMAPEHRAGVPLEHGWMARKGADDFARLVDYTDDVVVGGARYQSGESNNFTLVPMAQAAADQVAAWGIEAIGDAIRPLTDHLEQRCRDIGLDPVPAAARGPHLMGVRAPEGFADDLPERLREAGVSVSVRGDAIRVAAHAYNTIEECNRLVEVLATAV